MNLNAKQISLLNTISIDPDSCCDCDRTALNVLISKGYVRDWGRLKVTAKGTYLLECLLTPEDFCYSCGDYNKEETETCWSCHNELELI